jgi:hypothetical protein
MDAQPEGVCTISKLGITGIVELGDGLTHGTSVIPEGSLPSSIRSRPGGLSFLASKRTIIPIACYGAHG